MVHIGVLDESRLKLDYVLDLFNLPSPSAFWSASGKSARYIDFSLIGGGHPGRAKERTCEKARVVAAAPEEDSACCPQCFDCACAGVSSLNGVETVKTRCSEQFGL